MTDKERIDYIIEYSKMNMSEFARHIDLKGPYRIYDVRNEKNGILVPRHIKSLNVYSNRFAHKSQLSSGTNTGQPQGTFFASLKIYD